jgi:hypothetical protein
MEPEWISRLLRHALLTDTSRAQYATCLRYWQAWYALRYELSFPLALKPAVAVSDRVARDFTNDHLPVVRNHHILPLMDELIRSSLGRLGFNHHASCPSEATTIWRLRVLRSAHHFVDLPFHADIGGSLAAQLHDEWINANAALAMVRNVPSGREMVLRIRQACPDTRDGVRTAAMVTLLQYLTPRQLAALQFGDLVPGYIEASSHRVRCVEIHIQQPVNIFQSVFNEPRIAHEDAEVVILWGRVRLYDEFGDGVETAPAELPFIVRDMASLNNWRPVTARWITARLREAVTVTGIEAAYNYKRRYWASQIRLRCQRESEHQRNLMEAAYRARLTTSSAIYRLLGAP